jgi:hypothetical protein
VTEFSSTYPCPTCGGQTRPADAGEWIGTGTARVCDPCNVVIRWSPPLQVVTTTDEDEGAA